MSEPTAVSPGGDPPPSPRCPESVAASPETVAPQFEVQGRLVAITSIETGNVNDTYRVINRTTFSEEQFILQRINRRVFPSPAKVMANMKAVTDHAHRRIEQEADSTDRIWQLPRVIAARDGLDYVVDAQGEFWRALTLIASATSHPRVLDVEHAREAGIVLGHFQRIIADYPVAQLEDTLPGFHITPGYLRQHDDALQTAPARRRLSASIEARRIEAFIQARRALCPVLEDARTRGALRLRPIHGDPKITNIMIDDITGKGTAIVDLDTVKPGLVHYDFGDSVRSSCNPAGEEATDLRDVYLDIDLFEALLGGYLHEGRAFLTEADLALLYDSVRLIAFELGLRFFTDYLVGDRYFKISHEGQNLNRARVQMKLCESIETREQMIRRALARLQ